MRSRIITVIGLAVIGLPAIIYGGVFYYLLMGTFLVGGAWEYVRLFRAVHYEPNEIVTVGGVLVIATARFFFAEAASSSHNSYMVFFQKNSVTPFLENIFLWGIFSGALVSNRAEAMSWPERR